MTAAEYGEIEKYMLECMSDPAHDPEHVYRVLGRALELAESFGEVDYELLVISCLLHDIGRAEEREHPGLGHAAIGADKAAAWLAGRGYSGEFCEKVRHCIRAHSYRTGGRTDVLEAQLLYDADKLEAAGLLGLMRTAAYNARIGGPLYTLTPEGELDRREDAPQSVLREYRHKLRRVAGTLYTEPARQLAGEYTEALTRAVESLEREISDARNGLKLIDKAFNQK